MKLALWLFYLLLLLIPTQIGRHFFFNFSQAGGLYIDYLIPTVYLTDVIAVVLILVYWVSGAHRQNAYLKQGTGKTLFIEFLLFLAFLLFNVLFIARNQPVALYGLVKVVEYLLLGFVITGLKIQREKAVFFLSLAVVYSSVLGIWQFAIQKSVGGLWWLLGERTFSAGTPGIAAVNYGGELLLRAYGTFPHPNVLGGFLALALVAVLSGMVKRKMGRVLRVYYLVVIFLGTASLILTFSRVAWFTFLVGFLFMQAVKKGIWLADKMNKNGSLILIIFYSFIYFSALVSSLYSPRWEVLGRSWQERSILAKQAIAVIRSNQFLGVGLNNSIVRGVEDTRGASSLFRFQPVHHIFLLVFAETGLSGFVIFITLFSVMIFKCIRRKSLLLLAVIQLFLIGLFDHYPLTIQQGQLMFILVASLALSPLLEKQGPETEKGVAFLS